MPSLSINNDHGKTFTGSLATITAMGTPTYSVSAINAVYSFAPSIALTISDTSLLDSTTAGQGSGIILSGSVVNKTTKTKENFSHELPVLAVVGNMLLTVFNLPFTSIGLTNPSSGDELSINFNYSLQGAYTQGIIKANITVT